MIIYDTFVSSCAVISGEQLVHSRYLQQLCSLALLLRLDSVLCTQPAPAHVAHPEPGRYTQSQASTPDPG